jgi:hypothetical protein
MSRAPIWTAEAVATLRALWPDRDVPVADIASRVGLSVAACYNMASRHGLRRYAARGDGTTCQNRVRRPVEPFRIAFAPEPLAATPAPALPRPCECRWPLWAWGERPGASPRFCDAPASPGRAYCEEHAALTTRRRGEPWRKLPPPTLLGQWLQAA